MCYTDCQHGRDESLDNKVECIAVPFLRSSPVDILDLSSIDSVARLGRKYGPIWQHWLQRAQANVARLGPTSRPIWQRCPPSSYIVTNACYVTSGRGRSCRRHILSWKNNYNLLKVLTPATCDWRQLFTIAIVNLWLKVFWWFYIQH